MSQSYEIMFNLSAKNVREALSRTEGTPHWERSFLEQQRSWVRRWPAAVLLMVLAALGVLGIVEHALGGRFRWPVWVLLGFVSLIGAVAYVYSGIWNVGLYRRTVRADLGAQARALAVPGIIGPGRITLNEAGVMYDGLGTSVWASWAAVTEVDAEDDYLILKTLQQRWFIVPTEAIARVAPPGDVVRFAESCKVQAGGAERLIREFLADRRLACPACGYEVGGLETARCPECGRDVTVADLARAE
jgi:hypothetical protein